MNARARIATWLLVAVGVFNLLPGQVFLDPSRTVALYGLALDGESLVLLMRHRAVLLVLVYGSLIAAAFRPAWRPPAIAAAILSKIVFIGLYAAAEAPTPELWKVAAADVVSLALLVVAVWAGRQPRGA